MNTRAANRLFLATLLVSVVPLLGWWTYGLFDIDEGYYASVSWEMNQRGEWITPFFNGLPWYEKPVLLYWLAKPSILLFGEAVGPRLPSILACLATYALMFSFTRARFGAAAAAVATLVYATSLGVTSAGRMMLTDPVLVLCFTAALFSFWRSLTDDPRWRIVSAASLGLVVLAKGPAFLILFVAIAGYTFWREPALRPRFAGYWGHGTLVLMLIVAAWYVPAFLKDGQIFVEDFLIAQNIGRFTGGDEAHSVGLPLGLIVYPAVILIGMFPWILWLRSAWPKRGLDDADNAPLLRYLGTWAAVVVVFFTISDAKLPHYVMPAYPALAVLLGVALAKRWEARAYRPALLLPLWAGAMFLVTHFSFVWYYGASGQAELHALARWVRTQPGQYASYRMPRQEGLPRSSGKLPVDDQSRPSLPFYLRAVILDTNDMEALLQSSRKPVFILTRWNRVTQADVEAASRVGLVLERVPTEIRQEQYALWRLSGAN